MRMDMGRVDAALGQDVDPDVLKLERFVPQIKGERVREGRHMSIERGHHIGKDRKAPRQVGQ